MSVTKPTTAADRPQNREALEAVVREVRAMAAANLTPAFTGSLTLEIHVVNGTVNDARTLVAKRVAVR